MILACTFSRSFSSFTRAFWRAAFILVAFTELVSHYLFRDQFGRPGTDKGKVEGLVGSNSNLVPFAGPRSPGCATSFVASVGLATGKPVQFIVDQPPCGEMEGGNCGGC